MLPLETLFRLLDGLREEALQAAEYPSDEYKTEFGFGRVAGMLAVLRSMRERIEEAVAEANQQEDERG